MWFGESRPRPGRRDLKLNLHRRGTGLEGSRWCSTATSNQAASRRGVSQWLKVQGQFVTRLTNARQIFTKDADPAHRYREPIWVSFPVLNCRLDISTLTVTYEAWPRSAPDSLQALYDHYPSHRPGSFPLLALCILGIAQGPHRNRRNHSVIHQFLIGIRITRPLSMPNTGITLSSSMKQRMATGHNAVLAPVANWDLPTLAGAGALRSSANDMLTFLEAFLGYKETPLAPAMKAMLEVRRPVGKTNRSGQLTELNKWGTLGHTEFRKAGCY